MGYLDNTGLAYLWGKIKAKIKQPDWSQNDETAPDYVKNRPGGYVDGEEWSDVFNQTVIFTSSGASLWLGAVSVSYELFDIGKTYKVTWDNVEYDCVCGTINESKYLGNLAIQGQTPDTGEPFIVGFNSEQSVIVTSQTGSQHSVIIKAFVDKIIPIDSKYLPIASDDNYGMVTTKQVSKVYNLPESVSMDDLKEAVDAFENNGATVMWDGVRVASGYHDSQNYDICVVFTNRPFVQCHFKTKSIAANILTPDKEVYLGSEATSIKLFLGPNSSGGYDACDLFLINKDTLYTDATKMILNTGEVLTAGVQTLTNTQKQQARANIGLTPVAKNDAMTQRVGLDVDGGLYTEPGAWYVTVTQTSSDSVMATADKTAAEVYAAYQAGYVVYARVRLANVRVGFYVLPLDACIPNGNGGVATLGFSVAGQHSSAEPPKVIGVLFRNNQWVIMSTDLAGLKDIPTALPNPNALTIKVGDTTTTYDGSADKTVDIPDSTIIQSSTSGSTKKFRITVDDSGTLSAVEVTDAS